MTCNMDQRCSLCDTGWWVRGWRRGNRSRGPRPAYHAEGRLVLEDGQMVKEPLRNQHPEPQVYLCEGCLARVLWRR